MCNCEDAPCCGCDLERDTGPLDMSEGGWDRLAERDPDLFEALMDLDF